MSLRISLRATLRIGLVLLIGVALLPAPCVSMLVSAMGQSQGRGPRTGPPPQPGKPEGELPDLDDVKNESSIEREAPVPIPSTIRSRRNSGKPWDGRRVGDPPRSDLYEDQFIQNFFNVALVRGTTGRNRLLSWPMTKQASKSVN